MKNKKQLNIYKDVFIYSVKMIKEKSFHLFFCYFAKMIIELTTVGKNIFIPKLIIDEVFQIFERNDINLHLKQAIYILIFDFVATIFLFFFSSLINYISNIENEKIQNITNLSLTQKCLNLEFKDTENAFIIDQLNKAKEAINTYSGGIITMMNNFYDIILNFIILLSLLSVSLFKLPSLLPFQIISVFIYSFFLNKNNNLDIEFYKKKSTFDKFYSYYFLSLLNPIFGKDIRLFKADSLIDRKLSSYTSDYCTEWKDNLYKKRKNRNWMSLNDNLRNIIIYIFIGFKAVTKEISVGNFTLILNSYLKFFSSFCNMLFSIKEFMKRSIYFNNYLSFMNQLENESKGKKNIKNEIQKIEFKNVYFKYPGCKNYILKNISFKINKGEHISIVGKNGSGKSTILKLLCRLYKPNKGTILINDINIEDYDEHNFNEMIAVVFQDFKLFYSSIEENIYLNKSNNPNKISEILFQVDLFETVEKLKNKEKTEISKIFDSDGIELSGGQQQLLSIARALYKNSSLILLDEPDSALDPITYKTVFSKFKFLTQNKTSILISHKLTSYKISERILVIDKGRIIEEGNHKQLLSNGGLYKEMFNEQSKLY